MIKRNKLGWIALFFLVGCAMLGCTPKEETADSPIHFTVYGLVLDLYTGNPVSGAKVTLYYGTHGNEGKSGPDGVAGSSVSDSDGLYMIPCVTTDKINAINHHIYQIEATCYGYYGYSGVRTIMEEEGLEYRMDIMLN